MLSRNFIKNISLLTVVTLLLVSFSSCAKISKIVDVFSEKSEHTAYIENTVLDLINENDPEGLYDLFSEDARTNPNLLDRLRLLCFIWNELGLDEATPDFQHDTGGGKSYVDGDLVYDEQGYAIKVSVSGVSYSLKIDEFRIYKDHTEKEGVFAITLVSVNTGIYSTTYRKEKAISIFEQVTNCYEREERIVERLLELKEAPSYIQADDEERVNYVKNNLDIWIEEDIEFYGDCVIDELSISETHSNDGHGTYPALNFNFIDGATYTVIVHDNP